MRSNGLAPGTSQGGLSPAPSGGIQTPLLSRTPTPPLSRGPTPPLFLSSRVFDARQRKLAVERVNLARHWQLTYLSDLYHTLVNLPWYRFYLFFFVCYVSMYAAYAAFYMAAGAAPPSQCITMVDNYWHAFWFSMTSSATIGYGHQAPDPDCYLLQVGLMCQVLTSLLFEASLLGLVFARISNSAGRSATIRFSECLSMYRGEDGLYRLSFRVANIRRHQLLSPKVRMLLMRRHATHPFSSGGSSSEYIYSELRSQHVGGGFLWLGVPSVIEHNIDERSPLWGMAVEEIQGADMEIIVLLGGTDETTARAMEARHSYVPADIRWEQHFEPCIRRGRSGKLGVDFARFDSTQNLRGPSCEASGGVPFVPSGSSLAGAAAAQRNGPSSSTPAGGPAAQVQHVTFASAPGMPAPAAVAAAAMAESPFASGPDALAAPHAADVLPGTVADA
ncbi:G -activated inward rectifier potassium channel 4-like [Micractinium conductrix]|uniref:G -activated inward rectifier potassium channel 4-like n=1 Tax=Micractinium conductrix TaxID=554055 RepID=A0A2P6V598_9CHLO|nr:G -activated inward rectifier potassium channel 4-like [Micractinium conductrix]|eukprot:PSC69266.1 G -activated inward rectifier potassium channel 4-like [Micractinium conductrix]